MNVTDVLKVAIAVIGSLGGGGALALTLSSYLGKIWANRILESDRAKYQQLNTELQHNLDVATRRLQIELDTVSLVHKLRTTEEFSHLGELWKKLAVLDSTFSQIGGYGLRLVPGDPEEAKKYDAKCRQDFLSAGYDAQQFFFQEELFIPQDIAEAVKEALKFPAREPFFYASFHGRYEPSIAMKYREQVANDLKEFQGGLENIKTMMRARIAGEDNTHKRLML